jgi:hypothetical protein
MYVGPRRLVTSVPSGRGYPFGSQQRPDRGAEPSHLSKIPRSGDDRIRTGDPLRAKQVLYH